MSLKQMAAVRSGLQGLGGRSQKAGGGGGTGLSWRGFWAPDKPPTLDHMARGRHPTPDRTERDPPPQITWRETPQPHGSHREAPPLRITWRETPPPRITQRGPPTADRTELRDVEPRSPRKKVSQIQGLLPSPRAVLGAPLHLPVRPNPGHFLSVLPVGDCECPHVFQSVSLSPLQLDNCCCLPPVEAKPLSPGAHSRPLPNHLLVAWVLSWAGMLVPPQATTQNVKIT